MKRINLLPKLYFILLLFISIRLNAQTNPLAETINNYHKIFPKEKIYLSLDKSNYNAGDTLWFKSFLLNADYSASSRTDKIYIEIFNDSSKFIANRVIALNNGLGYGDFALKNNLPNGTYTIRAYTKWQQNFDDDYFFQKSFYIGNVGESTWLLNAYQKIKTVNAKESLDLKVRITNLNNEPAGLRPVELYLMEDNNIVMKSEMQTTLNGLIETQVPLPNLKVNSHYSFYIIDKKDQKKKARLPIILDDEGKLDLQFMPEGGYMVNDIYGRVAFKAIGANGISRNLNGKILTSKNESIAELTTIHNGMGSFFLLPKKGESYVAVYSINGKEYRQSLPIAKDEGTTLRIDHLSKPDSLYIYIKASEEKRITENYQLIVQTPEGNNITIPVNLKNGFATFKLPKKGFPDGIIHFTLFSPNQTALNERQAFLNFNKKMKLEIKAESTEYSTRDSISLALAATAEDGSPLSGTFSISVTNDQQNLQKTDNTTILSYFLLQSEIKGNIEDAGWYLDDPNSSKFLALDHLLLTQAWVGYKWDEMLKPISPPKYKAEMGNLIEGKVTGLFNKPMPNINITLLALGKTVFVTDTVSNNEGKFVFKNLPILDSAAYSIKIKNAKGKTSGASIFVEEFTPAKDNLIFKPITPWYINSDSTTLLNYYKMAAQRKKADEATVKADGIMLREVEIRSKERDEKEENFIVKTAWDAKFYKKIGKEELDKNPRRTLADLLREQIPGFGIGFSWTTSCSGRIARHNFVNYIVGSRLISHVMIDNVNTHMVSSGMPDQYNERTSGLSATDTSKSIFATNQYIFNTLNAEDIVDIVIYKGCAYFFLEITTRSGKGPWLAPTKGVYVHKPLPLYVPKEFYSPKYSVDKTSGTADLRSTIFWDANVVTDENGKARLSFYSADLPGTYTVKIEGTDMFGRFGYQKIWIPIKNKTESK